MSYTTELTDDYMGITHAGGGIVTGADLIKASRLAAQLVENTENFHFELIDFSDVDELRVTEAELEQIVLQDRYAAIFRPDATVVMVAPRADLFAIAEKWQRRVEGIGWKTHVARSRSEAKAWLQENCPQSAGGVAPAKERHVEDAKSS